MDSSVSAALFAFGTAIILAIWNSWLTRKAEIDKELRTALAELTRKLAGGNHAMSWLAWKAKYDPTGLTGEDISKYDTAMSSMYHELVGSRVVVAALNERIHKNLTPLIKKLYALDVAISKATVLYRSSADEGIAALASYHDDTLKFDDELLEQVTELIGSERAKR